MLWEMGGPEDRRFTLPTCHPPADIMLIMPQDTRLDKVIGEVKGNEYNFEQAEVSSQITILLRVVTSL
jgi:hypothetical protein